MPTQSWSKQNSSKRDMELVALSSKKEMMGTGVRVALHVLCFWSNPEELKMMISMRLTIEIDVM